MENSQATTFQRRVGETLVAPFSSKLLLNVIFLLTWVWGVYWIFKIDGPTSSVIFAKLPAMGVAAGVWINFLNRRFNQS